MNQDQGPIPQLGRMMVFIDGENLTARFQAMVKEGRRARDNVTHIPDVLVWNMSAVRPRLHHVLRATYYTYAIGDEQRIGEVSNQIKQLGFKQYENPWASHATSMLLRNLSPKVFHKYRNKKAKGLDIQMTVDVLSHVYQNNLDAVYLISGDGDYRPVLQEAIRFGKQVFVAALSSGLNEDLKYIADEFIDLDSCFFQPITE